MLRWAREWREKSIEEAAEKLKKSPDVISNWEKNIGSPTVKQARILAEFYGRHFLEFFLPTPPEIPSPAQIPDFRMHAGAPPPVSNWDLRHIQQWIETQRINALDLFEELRESPPEIPASIFASISSNPETAAAHARRALEFSIQEQVGIPTRDFASLPGLIRKKLEKLGVLTLRHNGLRDFGIRGICIAAFPLPVIVFRDESPTAQAFTLAHEFGHVLSRESGITGPRNSIYSEQPVEGWCDRFAASFLMPDDVVSSHLGPKPNRPADSIEDSVLGRVASIFRVSPHAMLIRLVHLGYVRAAYYWDIKKPEFDQEETNYRRFGRARYYGSRYRSSLGDLYTGLVIDAWSSGRITNHNAAEYMGIKNIAHLNDIKAAFLSR